MRKRIRGKRALVLSAAVGVGSLAASFQAQASTFTWTLTNTATTGNWSLAGNWSPSGPPVAGDVAIFGGATSGNTGTLTVDATGRSAATLIFSRNGAATLAASGGGTLTLSDGITAAAPSTTPLTYTITAPITLGGNNIWNVDSTNANTTLSVSSVISGSGFGITKIGSGTLIFGGANSYTGSTIINGGTLLLSTNDRISDSSAVVVDGGTAVFNLNTFSDQVGGLRLDNDGRLLGGSMTLTTGSYDIRSGTITTALRGAAGLTKTTGSVATISTNGTYSGATTINGGTLAVATLANGGSASGIGASTNAAGNLVINGGFLQWLGTADNSSDRNFTLGASGGGIDASASSNSNNLTLTGNMTASASTGSQTFTLTGTNTGTNLLSGVIANGSGSNVTNLAKEGAGMWILNGNNTYTGTTTITAGTLQVGNGTTTGALGSGVVTNNANLVFNRSNASTFTNEIDGSGNLYKTGSGTLTLTATDSAYMGATVISGGTLEAYVMSNGQFGSSIGAATNDPANLVLNGGTLRYLYQGTIFSQAALDAGQIDRRFTLGTAGGTIDVSGNGPLNFYNNATVAFTGSGARTLTLAGTYVDSVDGTNNYNALRLIIGDGTGGATSIVKTGSGEWVLTGQNTYTGSTTINAGTLLLAHGDTNNITNYTNVLPVTTTVSISTGGELALYTGDSGAGHNLEPLSQTIAGLTGGGIVSLNAGSLIVSNTSGTNTYNGLIRDTIADGSIVNQTGGSFGKAGAGTQVLGGTNTYTGPTYITGGVLSVATLANGGANSNIGSSGSLASNLVLNGGALRYTGSTNASIDRLFTLGTGGGTIDASGSGSLQFNNTSSFSFSGSGARTLNLAGTNTGNNTFAPIITDGTGGATSLAKHDAGKWIVTAVNTYTGATTINGGTLALLASNRLPTATDLTINGSGALDITNVTQTVNSLNSSSANASVFFGSTGSLLVNYSGGSPITYAGDFTSSSSTVGGLVKSGTGTLSLTASNANVFATSITGGVLEVNDLDDGGGGGASSLGSTANVLTLSGGGILRYDDGGAGDDDAFSHNFTLGVGGGAFDASGGSTGSMSVTGAITVSGAGARTLTLMGTNTDNNVISTVIGGGSLTNVTKTGTGIWQPTSNNTYTGVTTINGGTLVVSSLANGGSNSPIGASGSLASNLILDGGTLRWTGGVNTTIDRLFSVGTASGAVDASGAGFISFSNTGPMGFNSQSGTRTLTLRGSSSLNNAISAVIGDNGGATSLVKADAGRWILNGANTYTGTTTISGGTLAEGASNVLSDSTTVVVNGSTAVWDLGSNHAETVAGVTLAGGGTLIGSGSSAVTLNTGSYDLQNGRVAVPLNGSAGISKTANSTVGISAAAGYTGTTAISAGTLQLLAANMLPSTTATTMSGGTFDMNGFAQTIGSLAGSAGTVDLGAAVLTVGDSNSTTFAGTIIGAAGSGIIKQGSGSLTLTANNTYVGTTTITSGVLEVKKLSNNNASSGIGQPGTTNAGSLVINGGTLRYSGTGDSTDRLFTMGLSGSTLDVSTGPATFTGGGTYVASGTGARTLTLTGDNVGTLAGIIGESGTTSLVKTGSGRWVISNGAQIFTGSTTINQGTLDISTIANANTNSGIGRSDATNPASKLSINGGYLRFVGSTAQSSNRNWTLGANGGGFDASGTVAAATLTLSGAMTAPAGGAQTFTLTGTQTANNTYSGQIVNGTSGNVTSLTKDGTGKWLLSNANNTYTGTTTVNNGTLALGGGTINNIASSPTINVRNNTSNLDVTASGLTLSTTVDQTLSGNGTVYGAVTASGAHNTTISPGNSHGKLTFANAGDISLSTAATVEMEVGGDGIGGIGVAGTNYDQIVLSSTPSKAMIINGAKLRLLPQAGIVSGQAYTLIATSGAGATINFSTVFKNLDNTPMTEGPTYTQGPVQFSLDYDNTFVKVTFTTVPEPTSMGLVMLAAPALLGRRKRRRRA